MRWVLPVQVGRALEPVILDFYAHQTGSVVYRDERVAEALETDAVVFSEGRHAVQHPDFDWVISSFDGVALKQGDRRIVEAKTTNYWNATKQTPSFIASYASQQQWYLEVAHAVAGIGLMDFVWLVDNNKIEIATIERDPDFATILLGEAEEFWEHVLRDIEPRKGRPAPPLPKAKIVNTQTYDMLQRKEGNAWTDAARRWELNRLASAAYVQAVEDIKALVPEDARRCTGAGIVVTRDKAGRITITEEKSE